jgi:hypothetical protein
MAAGDPPGYRAEARSATRGQVTAGTLEHVFGQKRAIRYPLSEPVRVGKRIAESG